MTPEQLARILYEELDRDAWGDIDPFWFKAIADGEPYGLGNDENEDDARALRAVLERVIARI